VVKKPRAVTYKACTAKLERGSPLNVDGSDFSKAVSKESENYK